MSVHLTCATTKQRPCRQNLTNAPTLAVPPTIWVQVKRGGGGAEGSFNLLQPISSHIIHTRLQPQVICISSL